MPTTPPPCLHVGHVLPELAGRERSTFRLHPRRGEESPCWASKIGGAILWPTDEPWPQCEEHALPFVAVLQLRAEEFPEFPFRDGSDLFQLLWCPQVHLPFRGPDYVTKTRAYWRSSQALKGPFYQPPGAKILSPGEWLEADDRKRQRFADENLVPKPCQVFPERVAEYPEAVELTPEQLDRLNRWPGLQASEIQERLEDLAIRSEDKRGGETLYWAELSVCPGSKVGGYVAWLQAEETPVCDCGHKMDHLVTLASGECSLDRYRRWAADDEQPCWERWPAQLPERLQGHGMMFGDCGWLYHFICTRCPAWPIRQVHQCS